jgi:hypothetical protein
VRWKLRALGSGRDGTDARLSEAIDAAAAAVDVARGAAFRLPPESVLVAESQIDVAARLEKAVLLIGAVGEARVAAARRIPDAIGLVLDLFEGRQSDELSGQDRALCGRLHEALRDALLGATSAALAGRFLEVKLRLVGPRRNRIEVVDRQRGVALSEAVLYEGNALNAATAWRDILAARLARADVEEAGVALCADLLDAVLAEGGTLLLGAGHLPEEADLSTAAALKDLVQGFTAVRSELPAGVDKDDIAPFLSPDTDPQLLALLGLDCDAVIAARRRQIAAEGEALTRATFKPGEFAYKEVRTASKKFAEDFVKEYIKEKAKDSLKKAGQSVAKAAGKAAAIACGAALLGPLMDIGFDLLFDALFPQPKPKPLTVDEVRALIAEMIGENNDMWYSVRLSDAYHHAYNAFTTRTEDLLIQRLSGPGRSQMMGTVVSWNEVRTAMRDFWDRVALTSQSGWRFEAGRMPIVDDAVQLYTQIVCAVSLADDLHYTYEQWLTSPASDGTARSQAEYEAYVEKCQQYIADRFEEFREACREYELILEDSVRVTYIETLRGNGGADFKERKTSGSNASGVWKIVDDPYWFVNDAESRPVQGASGISWTTSCRIAWAHNAQNAYFAALQCAHAERIDVLIRIRNHYNEHFPSVPLYITAETGQQTLRGFKEEYNQYRGSVSAAPASAFKLNLSKKRDLSSAYNEAHEQWYAYVWFRFPDYADGRQCWARLGVGDYPDIGDIALGVFSRQDWDKDFHVMGIYDRASSTPVELHVPMPYRVFTWPDVKFQGGGSHPTQAFPREGQGGNYRVSDPQAFRSMQIRLDLQWWYQGLQQFGRNFGSRWKRIDGHVFLVEPDMEAIWGPKQPPSRPDGTLLP